MNEEIKQAFNELEQELNKTADQVYNTMCEMQQEIDRLFDLNDRLNNTIEKLQGGKDEH
jgi:uncharacterized coiled-coil DUF342 family protein